MTFRKYRTVSVSPRVYCSSTGDYFFRVGFDVYQRQDDLHLGRSGIDFYWGGSYQEDLPRMPQYLEMAIYAAILELLQSDRVKFYEINQYQEARYENLRYHRPEDLPWLIDRTQAILDRSEIKRPAEYYKGRLSA